MESDRHDSQSESSSIGSAVMIGHKDVMVDIETMATHETEALVLSFATVEFKLTPQSPVVGVGMKLVLDPREQLILGRRVERDTVKWWSEQHPSAIADWLRGEVTPLRAAMVKLSDFIGNRTIWANGIMFDLGNLRTLMVQSGVDVPWKYNATRDARTIYRCCPQLRSADLQRPGSGAAHDPIADCLSQIWGLWEHLPESTMEQAP